MLAVIRYFVPSLARVDEPIDAYFQDKTDPGKGYLCPAPPRCQVSLWGDFGGARATGLVRRKQPSHA